MRIKNILIFSLLIVSASTFAQDAKKMAKNLSVTPTEQFDKTAPIFFDRKNPEKHGFEDISAMFKNAFIKEKFTVKENPRFLLLMDYDYGYVISGYRFQYSNLTAEVVDLNNNKTVVATIVYKGRFEIDAVADAVAAELAKTNIPANSKTTKTEVSQNETLITPAQKTITKTKEEKLVELKQFYDKQLITKEEYQEQKKKVLAE
jgi:hypothetical protein